jgi:hypothetical protein
VTKYLTETKGRKDLFGSCFQRFQSSVAGRVWGSRSHHGPQGPASSTRRTIHRSTTSRGSFQIWIHQWWNPCLGQNCQDLVLSGHALTDAPRGVFADLLGVSQPNQVDRLTTSYQFFEMCWVWWLTLWPALETIPCAQGNYLQLEVVSVCVVQAPVGESSRPDLLCSTESLLFPSLKEAVRIPQYDCGFSMPVLLSTCVFVYFKAVLLGLYTCGLFKSSWHIGLFMLWTLSLFCL